MKTVDLGLGGGSLLQIANRDHTQMMAYRIQTDSGKIIMIDSGNYKREKDGENLYRLLMESGGKVDAWFLTHAHSDHIGGLAYIWEKYGNVIEIKEIIFDFPDEDWLKEKNGTHSTFCVELFLKYIKEFGIKITKPKKGDLFDFGVQIEVLNSLLPNYRNYRDINDSGICLKAHFKNRSVLFLGDLGEAAEEDFLKEAGDKVQCEVVQLAHHGQDGVSERFYRLVDPKVCLWCTPDWLWENDNGGGSDSGGWKTLETRSWMERLGVAEHYIAKDGDYLFI